MRYLVIIYVVYSVFSNEKLRIIFFSVLIHHNLSYMPPSKLSFSLISAVDQCPRVNDVEKTFQLLLYLLKQDPLEQSLFDDEP